MHKLLVKYIILVKHMKLVARMRLFNKFELLPGAGLTTDVAIGEAKETPRGAYEYIFNK